MTLLLQTLGNKEWMTEHLDDLRRLLPETWTNVQNFQLVPFGFKLKVLGVDWRSEEELIRVMMFLEKSGIMLRDGFLIRRSRLDGPSEKTWNAGAAEERGTKAGTRTPIENTTC